MADKTISINSFKYGLDTRREALASLPGTLVQAINCQVNSGAELDKRKAFVALDSAHLSLPVGCFGLQDTDSGLMTFGSIATPANIPAGVTYQRLSYPTNPAPGSMGAVLFSCSYLGKAFVLASFDNTSTVFAYYDGTLVAQITDGIVNPSPGGGGVPETLSDLANDLAGIVNRALGPNDLGTLNWFAHANKTAVPYNGVANNTDWTKDGTYNESSATVPGSVLVMSPPNVHFTPTVKNNNSALGELGMQLVDQNYPGLPGKGSAVAFILQSSGANTSADTVTLTAPAKADGSGTFQLTNGAIAYATSLVQTCTNIATAVNNNTFITGYTAISSGTTVTVFAPPSFGAFSTAGVDQLTVVTVGNLTTIAGTIGANFVINVTPTVVSQTVISNATFVTVHGSVKVLTSGSSGTVTYEWQECNPDGTTTSVTPSGIQTSVKLKDATLKTGDCSFTAPNLPRNTALSGYFLVTATDSGSSVNTSVLVNVFLSHETTN